MHWISDPFKSLRSSDSDQTLTPSTAAAATTGGDGGGYISAGIRSDLAEFGGSLRSSFSLLSSPRKAVSDLSKFASSFLRSDSDDDDVRVSEEVIEFVEETAARAELWTEFPMSILDDDFVMSPSQAEHVSLVEKLAPNLAALRVSLRSDMSDNLFWMIYFILLLPQLDEYNFTLLSTRRIVEARETLLTMQQTMTARSCVDEQDLNELETVRKPSRQKPTSVENPESSKEMGNKRQEIITKRSKEDADVSSRSSDAERQLQAREGVSFSDLENDDKDLSDRRSATRVDSDEWVRLNEKSDTQDDCRSRLSELSSRGKDSEDEANEWLKIDEWITNK